MTAKTSSRRAAAATSALRIAAEPCEVIRHAAMIECEGRALLAEVFTLEETLAADAKGCVPHGDATLLPGIGFISVRRLSDLAEAKEIGELAQQELARLLRAKKTGSAPFAPIVAKPTHPKIRAALAEFLRLRRLHWEKDTDGRYDKLGKAWSKFGDVAAASGFNTVILDGVIYTTSHWLRDPNEPIDDDYTVSMSLTHQLLNLDA